MLQVYTNISNNDSSIIIFDNNDILIYAQRIHFFQSIPLERKCLKTMLETLKLLDKKYTKSKVAIYFNSSYYQSFMSQLSQYSSEDNEQFISSYKNYDNFDIIYCLYKYYTKNSFINQIKFVKIDKNYDNIKYRLSRILAANDIKQFMKILSTYNIQISLTNFKKFAII